MNERPTSEAPARAPRRAAGLTVITTSEVQCARDCMNRHHFKYRERLRPKVEGKALAIGHIFHGGMSAGLLAGWSNVDGLTVDERLERQIAASTAKVDAQVQAWVQAQALHDRNADYSALEAFATDGAEMLRFMLSNYLREARGDLTALMLVDVEAAFAVRLRDSIGRTMPVRFDGVRDALFYDPVHNALELHEHKTVSNMPEDIGKRAEMDPQTAGYMYALLELRKQGALKFFDGRPVPQDAVLGRVAYNAVRKKRPRQPNVNQDGRVSVAAIDTTAEIYIRALDDQAARGIPVNEKQLAKAQELATRRGAYYHRHEFYRTREEIERWRVDIAVDAARIRQAERDPRFRTRNPGHCNMPWSLSCEYRPVCLDDTPETRALYNVSSDAHPEVREAEAAFTGSDSPF